MEVLQVQHMDDVVEDYGPEKRQEVQQEFIEEEAQKEAVDAVGKIPSTSDNARGKRGNERSKGGDRSIRKKDNAPEKRKHYVTRKCPLCATDCTQLKGHILNLQINKNQQVPLTRLNLLFEMAVHGEHRRGGREVRKLKCGGEKVYTRFKHICPKCDKVVLYLSKHLRNIHHIHKESEDYTVLMTLARKYTGKRSEIKWDCGVISRKRKTQRDEPSTSTKRHRLKHLKRTSKTPF